jgi:hypothetical protein
MITKSPGKKQHSAIAQARAALLARFIPLTLTDMTYFDLKQAGLSRGDVDRAVNALVEAGVARIEETPHGLFIHRVEPVGTN